MTTRTIDLNADAGEDPRALTDGRERALLQHVSAVNIATGAHAGSDATMRDVCTMALALGLAIAAHPAYPDRGGFGRTSMAMSDDGRRTLIRKQVDALHMIAHAAGCTLTRVKPHGALYHDASNDVRTMHALLDTTDPGLALVLPPTATTLDIARDAGHRVLLEGFADRAYRDDGTLVPRSEPGAVITDASQMIEQCLRLIEEGVAGHMIDTICLHSDTPNAAERAHELAYALRKHGITIRAPEHGA